MYGQDTPMLKRIKETMFDLVEDDNIYLDIPTRAKLLKLAKKSNASAVAVVSSEPCLEFTNLGSNPFSFPGSDDSMFSFGDALPVMEPLDSNFVFSFPPLSDSVRSASGSSSDQSVAIITTTKDSNGAAHANISIGTTGTSTTSNFFDLSAEPQLPHGASKWPKSTSCCDVSICIKW